jgi:putative cell wall binding repeat protein/WD40 repeat protein
MRSLSVRQRMVQVAAAGAVVLLAAACGNKTGSSTPDGATGEGGLGSNLRVAAGTLIVSDGSTTVRVGDQTVTFPTTVTDAVVSPDGSRIAYVDSDSNVSVSKLDGSGRAVLTKTTAGVTRSRPTWHSASIVFAEKRPDGTSAIVGVEANGCDTGNGPAVHDIAFDTGDNTSYVDLAPASQDRVGPGYRFVFQHEEKSGSEVWIADNTQRGSTTEKLADGTEPSFSPDGTRLAYVARNGQITVRSKYWDAASGKAVTTAADHPTHLTWTPDGNRIAYTTSKGIESVPADGGTPNALADKPGVATFVRPQSEVVNRITGADQIALAVAASQTYWPTVTTAFMSQGFSGAHEALLTAPGVMPGQQEVFGPLLLTGGDALDPRTLAEMQRMFGDWKGLPELAPHITIVGGTDVISAKVATDLTNKGYKVTRAAAGAAPGAGNGACGFQAGLAAGLAQQSLVVVNPSSAPTLAVATELARIHRAALLKVDPAAGLSAEAKEWLSRSAASVNTVYIVDPDGNAVPADVERQISDLVAGPLGETTAKNPTVKPLN